jgi:hypothetical protein
VTVRVTDTAGRASEASATYTATAPQSYTLRVTVSGPGSVSGATMVCRSGQTCSLSEPAGTGVTLNASANVGARFLGWSGACPNTGVNPASCALTMDRDQTTTATFETVSTKLPAPTLISPADGATFNEYPRKMTFQWSTVSGSDGGRNERYTIEIQYEDQTQPGGWVPYPSATAGPYGVYTLDNFIGAQRGRWRVSAYNTADPTGTRSDPTAWWTFRHLR